MLEFLFIIFGGVKKDIDFLADMPAIRRGLVDPPPAKKSRLFLDKK